MAHPPNRTPRSSSGPRFKPTAFNPTNLSGASQRKRFFAATPKWGRRGLWLVKGLLVLSLSRSFCVTKFAGSLSSERLQQYRGKIVVLNFWAAWCKPCKKETPILMELQTEFEARGVQFLGACTDDTKDREKAEAFVRASAISYPIWFDVSDQEMKQLGLGSSIPATAIYDREGKRTFRLIGQVKKKQLVERLEWLLGDQQGHRPKELLLPALVDSSEYREQ